MRSLFLFYLSRIAELTEIDSSRILSKERTEEVVQARAMLCYLLMRKGFSISETARLLDRSRADIHYILSNHIDEIKKKAYFISKVEKI